MDNFLKKNKTYSPLLKGDKGYVSQNDLVFFQKKISNFKSKILNIQKIVTLSSIYIEPAEISKSQIFQFCFIFLLPIFSSAQVVEETIQLDTITETIKVIYKPSTSTSYYQKKTAVFANDTSQVAIEKTFARGVQNGIYKVYYPSGRLKVKAVFANGKHNGEFTWYQPDGIIYVKGVYENGIKHGYWAYKYLKRYGRYKNGKRNKMWYTPDANNKKVKSRYKNGVLVKGKGFEDDVMILPDDTAYQKDDTTIVEATQPPKHANEQSIDKRYEQTFDFLANNAFFRKTIKAYYKKDIQKFKKNYKKDVFQFKVAEKTPKMEINSFIQQSEAGKVEVAVIDYILKNETEALKTNFNVSDIVIDKNVVEKGSSKESESTVYFSEIKNNLLRIDVVWNPTKEIKTENTTFKVLLYFDDKGVLKGAEYQKP